MHESPVNSPIHDVSDTALWVAAYRALESERPDALFQDPLAGRLAGERGRAIAREMPYGHMTAWMMAVRTVAIDTLVADALAAGVDTIVNIGTGLDTRPYRLNLPKDLHWVEVDFPNIIDLKTKELANVTPHCRLTRHALNVADRAIAAPAYAAIGAEAKTALVITEGVLPYLTVDEAGALAEDLARVPSFRFWIQDYRKSGKMRRHPKKLREKMKNAPFRFHHPDPLGYFAGYGWSVRKTILALDESRRVGRPLPIKFPWTLMLRFLSEARKKAAREAFGFALLERR